MAFPIASRAECPTSASLNGQSGVMKVIAAKGLRQDAFSIHTDWGYFSSSELLKNLSYPGRYEMYDSSTGVSFGITDWMEFSINGLNSTSKIISPDRQRTRLLGSPGALETGVRLSYIAPKFYALGVYAYGKFLGAVDEAVLAPEATGIGGRLLFTLDLEAENIAPVRVHLNGGYYSDHSRFIFKNQEIQEPAVEYAMGVLRDDQLPVGFAVESPISLTRYAPSSKMEAVSPFVEYSTEQVIDFDGNNSKKGYKDKTSSQSPQRMILGVKLMPLKGVCVQTGYSTRLSAPVKASDIQVNPNVTLEPQWKIYFGASYSYLPKPPGVIIKEIPSSVTEPPKGKITGKVVDSKTGLPLGGAIVVLKFAGLTNLSTGDKTGAFIIPDLDPGTLEIEFRKEGYTPFKESFAIEGGKTKNKDIKLVEIPKIGFFGGKIMDAKGRPLTAVIAFDNPEVKPGTSDPNDGTFYFKLPAGTNAVTVTVQGFKPGKASVRIEDNKRLDYNFILEPDRGPGLPMLPLLPKKGQAR